MSKNWVVFQELYCISNLSSFKTLKAANLEQKICHISHQRLLGLEKLHVLFELPLKMTNRKKEKKN
jgi:hypothetical protein